MWRLFAIVCSYIARYAPLNTDKKHPHQYKNQSDLILEPPINLKFKDMKKLMLLLMLMCISSGMSAQRYATVKREGGFTNIRRGPGTGYAIVKKERDGNGIYVGSNVGGWYEVYSGPNGGFVGYISSNKVVFGGSSYNRPQKTYNTGSNLMRVRVKPEGGYTNLRSGPGTGYRIIGKVQDGSWVYTDAAYNGTAWSKIYYANGTFRGWIADSKLRGY